MPIPVLCPGCNSRLKAPDAVVGKTVKCPKCQADMIVIPASADASLPGMPVEAWSGLPGPPRPTLPRPVPPTLAPPGNSPSSPTNSVHNPGEVHDLDECEATAPPPDARRVERRAKRKLISKLIVVALLAVVTVTLTVRILSGDRDSEPQSQPPIIVPGAAPLIGHWIGQSAGGDFGKDVELEFRTDGKLIITSKKGSVRAVIEMPYSFDGRTITIRPLEDGTETMFVLKLTDTELVMQSPREKEKKTYRRTR